MKKFYFLTLALICAFVANATVTIYAKKSGALSSTAKLYFWNGGLNTAWPGVNMTETTLDGEAYWKYELNPTGEFNIIFNNGSGKQTADILGLSPETSEYKFEVKSDWSYEILAGQVAEYKDVVIYAEKSGALSSKAVLYYWGAVENAPSWPGVNMTETTVNGKAYWTATISANGDFNIIFNDGNSAQTADITGLSNEIPAYYYAIKADWSFDTTTAIDEVAADNAAVEYYNLQGVKVANPENGIFIKKQGNKVAKVVL